MKAKKNTKKGKTINKDRKYATKRELKSLLKTIEDSDYEFEMGILKHKNEYIHIRKNSVYNTLKGIGLFLAMALSGVLSYLEFVVISQEAPTVNLVNVMALINASLFAIIFGVGAFALFAYLVSCEWVSS